MKKALIFGATGFIGSSILEQLLDHPAYEQVTVVVRKNIVLKHPKLKVLIGNDQDLLALRDQLVADEIFIAIGTTKKATPDPKRYYQIDHDYPVLAAKFAREHGARSVLIVTAVGADAVSNLFYVKTKSEIERDIIDIQFPQTQIFRPSMIMGPRQENRTFEKTLIQVWSLINPFLVGRLNRYRGIEGQDVAKAMVNAAQQPIAGIKIYNWQDYDWQEMMPPTKLLRDART